MAYTPTNWTNFPSTATPVNANNLNKIENELVALDTGKADATAVTSALADKVDKVEGKGLSTNDFDNTYKDKLDGISSQANKVEITPVVTEGTTLATISIDGVDTDIKGSDIEVDDEMSPTSTNPVQNKVIYETLQNILPEETAEGNPISITDASGLSAKSCEVTINPIQDLHGQSAPYPAGGGKNKLPMTLDGIKTANTSGSWNGNVYSVSSVTFIVLTDNGGNVESITVNGTPSATVNLFFPEAILTDGTAYKLNGCPSGGSISAYALMHQSNSNIIDSGNGIEFIKASTDNGVFRIRIQSGYTCNNLLFKPMLRLSTETDSTFAPYSNICPISRRDSLVLAKTGKNLLAKPFVYDDSVGFNLTDYFFIKAGTYTFAFDTISATSWRYVVRMKDKNGNDLSDEVYNPLNALQWSASRHGWINKTNITNKTCYLIFVTDCYIRITFALGDTSASTTVTKAQLELGSTATAYEPYQGQTHTATFPSTTIGGSYDFVSGMGSDEYNKITISSSVTVNTFTADSTNGSWARLDIQPRGKISSDNIMAICSMATGVSYNNRIAEPTKDRVYVDENGYIVLRASSTQTITTQAELLSYFDGAEICYKKATPTTITLTPETIALLKGNNTLWTDGDNITLKYSAGIKQWVLAQLQS